jgi:hypothetical protein
MINLHPLFAVNDESLIVPIIYYEEGDELIHTDDHPLCDKEGCPCGGVPTAAAEEDQQEEEQA